MGKQAKASALIVMLLASDGMATANEVTSVMQARHLGEVAITHLPGAEKFPSYRPDLNRFNGKDARFYFFEEIAPSGIQGSAHIRSIAVNKATGDVWEIEGVCEHLWPTLSHKQVAGLKTPRGDTPWECDKPQN